MLCSILCPTDADLGLFRYDMNIDKNKMSMVLVSRKRAKRHNNNDVRGRRAGNHPRKRGGAKSWTQFFARPYHGYNESEHHHVLSRPQLRRLLDLIDGEQGLDALLPIFGQPNWASSSASCSIWG